MTGLQLVAIAPEHRGAGLASQLVRTAVVELHAGGVGWSTLFPSTQPLYRQAGYEQAGSCVRWRLSPSAIDLHERGAAAVERVGAEGRPALQALYTARARTTAGNLDRNAWAWRRVFEPGGSGTETFQVVGGGGIEGYAVVQQQPRDAGRAPRYDLHLRDLVVLTAAAGRRLLALLADHRSVVPFVEWNGPPNETFGALLGEQATEMSRSTRWLGRVCHVPAALKARGYPVGLQATLDLEIDDDLIPENAGRWRLEVAGGAAEVARGGEGRLRVHVRGLAALYTGQLAPADLAALGLLAGSAADQAAAAAVFAGPAPWMVELF